MYSKDYPKVIEIQFHNKCNSNCLICPYKDMQYNYENMSEELFDKFLNEIDETKLVRLIPYLNNEPFLDRNFVDKVEKIRSRYKKIELEISSNVSVISEEDIDRLSKMNITDFRLSVFGYSQDTYKKLMPGLNREITFKKLEMISEKLKNSNTVVSIVMIDNNEIPEEEFINMAVLCEKLGFKFERWGYLDRSNNVTYKSNNISNERVCTCEQNRPIERMHILSNGDVIFCCQDWKHTIVLGNIKKNTISEIWNGQQYNDVRESLYNVKTNGPEICKRCKLGH